MQLSAADRRTKSERYSVTKQRVNVEHWFPNWGAYTHCWGGASNYYEVQFLLIKLFLF